ncbi:MAG: sulfite exporter TauE/SafE family protein [Cyclobacteriaceae bacterium]|nr:sulfite exporter TauE/SafE family protein [Cyclobacteriaceae bacterium]
MWLYIILGCIGFTGGILTGLLGIGSGIIYVFILPYALKYHDVTQDVLVQYTIANSFFGMTFASLSASVTNYFHKDIYWKESLLVSIPGAVISIFLLKLIVVRSWYSYQIFSILLIGFLLFILISYHLKKKTPPVRPSLPVKTMVLSGLASGSLSALTGLGGGGILIPILSFKYHMDIKKAKSISLVMIFLISLTLTLMTMNEIPRKLFSEYQSGYILFPVALPLSLGVIAGSPAGVKLSHQLSSRIISLIFSLIILIVVLEKLISTFRF